VVQLESTKKEKVMIRTAIIIGIIVFGVIFGMQSIKSVEHAIDNKINTIETLIKE
jgi:hypothetical protein